MTVPAEGVSDIREAWEELRRVGAELLPDAVRTLGPDDIWQIELLDAKGSPIFIIRVVAEMPTG